MLRFQGFFDGCVLLLLLFFGMVAVALPSLGWGCLQSFPGGVVALLAAPRDGCWSCCGRQQFELSVRVGELESDYEPDPPCTMVDTQGTDVFDVPAEARLRGLDEHELMHFVFEQGLSHGGMPTRVSACSGSSGEFGNWRLSSLLRSGILEKSWSRGWTGTLPRLEGGSLTRR